MANTPVFSFTETTALAGADVFYVSISPHGLGDDRRVSLDTVREDIRDTVAAALVGGTDITVTVDDPGNTITIAYSGAPPPADTDDLPEGTTNLYFTDARAEAAVGPVRELLTAARTYFVRTTGSDSNDGLTAGTAFLTVQKAVDTATMLDLSIYDVVIDVGAGTFVGDVVLRSGVGAGRLILRGAGPTSTILAPISVLGLQAVNLSGPAWVLDNLQIDATGKVFGLAASTNYTNVEIANTLRVKGPSRAAVFAAAGAKVLFDSARWPSPRLTVDSAAMTQVLEANGAGTFLSFSGSTLEAAVPITVTQTAAAVNLGQINAVTLTAIGTFTGKRFDSTFNALITSGGLGGSNIPGTLAGTTATGGQVS